MSSEAVATVAPSPAETDRPSVAIVCAAAACGAIALAFALIGLLSLAKLSSVPAVVAQLGAQQSIEDAIRASITFHGVLALVLAVPFVGTFVLLMWPMTATWRGRTVLFAAAGILPAFFLAGWTVFAIAPHVERWL